MARPGSCPNGSPPTHVITVSEYVRQTTLLRGIPEDRVTTVPNLVDPSAMAGSDRDATRAELGIGEDDVVIIGSAESIGARASSSSSKRSPISAIASTTSTC